MGYPADIINLLTKLYGEQQAKARVAGKIKSEFRVKKGVRQGCIISPYIFNIMAEMVAATCRCSEAGYGSDKH